MHCSLCYSYTPSSKETMATSYNKSNQNKTNKYAQKPKKGSEQQAPYSREQLRSNQIQSLLDDVLNFKFPADSQLSRWFRERKKLGAKDRSEVAEVVFDIVRHLRLYRQYAQSGEGPLNRRLALLGLRSSLGHEYIDGLLTQYEREWLEHVDQIDLNSLPQAVRYSFPEWLMEHLSQLDKPQELLEALNQKASLDIRVNPFKITRKDALALMEQRPYSPSNPEPTPYSPWGIRLSDKPALNRWPLFEKGLIEVQDEGSQILCELVSPRRGEFVIDFCAGAGGKSLLLGAMMKSTGRLYALDVSEKRLARAKPRVARAGLSNITFITIRDENDTRVKRLAKKASRVLVDAPCSGIGTLRRNPDLKWRQSTQSLAELVDLQKRILYSAARCVAPNGRLVYSTCSLLPQENEAQVQQFLADHPDFIVLNAQETLGDRAKGLDADDNGFLKLRPDTHQTDGFFAAVLQRKAD